MKGSGVKNERSLIVACRPRLAYFETVHHSRFYRIVEKFLYYPRFLAVGRYAGSGGR